MNFTETIQEKNGDQDAFRFVSASANWNMYAYSIGHLAKQSLDGVPVDYPLQADFYSTRGDIEWCIV